MMASPDQTSPPIAADEKLGAHDIDSSINGASKRKASVDGSETGSLKRTKQDLASGDAGYRSPPRDRRQSIARHRSTHDEPSRNPSNTFEDKKRSQRLFGGLLSTLSQTNVSSQQKRRQEIEKRQQDRMQKQKVEDKQKQEGHAAQLNQLRMKEQMIFEERVMEHKHARIMWEAQYLQTKARPPLYYRPIKLTREQEELIEFQVNEAKKEIRKQQEAFRGRERQHAERYGPRRLPPFAQAKNEALPGEKVADNNAHAKTDVVHEPASKDENYHDENNEVVWEADEDTVIY